jgi:putative nucleotidyltransferase with HDIG domain
MNGIPEPKLPESKEADMKVDKIKKTIESIRELPTLSLVANKINAILHDPKSSVSDLTKIIEKDQSITTKVLKLVNSAHYGLLQKVNNINQAIALLGYRNVSYIVMTLSVFDALKYVEKRSFDRRKFWIHSIAVGILSQKLARESDFLLLDDIFTAGLLHDLGKVFMDGFMHEEFEQIISKAENEGLSYLEAERVLFDVDHTIIGEWMARTWRLPLHVVAAIKHHHHDVPDRKGLSLSQDPFIDVVRLADTAVKLRGFGSSGDGSTFKPAFGRKLYKRLPITQQDVDSLLGDLEKDLKKSEALLNLAL